MNGGRAMTTGGGRWTTVLAGGLLAALLALAGGVAATTVESVPGLPATAAAVRFGLPVARLATDLGGVVATGLAVLPLLLATTRPAEATPIRTAAQRAGLVTGVCWLLAVAVTLSLEAAELAGRGVDIGTAPVLDYALHASPGRALLVTGCAAAAFAVLAVVGLRAPGRVPAGLPFVIALLGLLPGPLTGHAADGPLRELTVLAISLHTVGAAVWVGGLGAVFVLAGARRSVLAGVLPRFSLVAAGCLGTVAVSGLLLAAARLAGQPEHPFGTALFGTGYGWIVLAKLVCLLALAGVGGYTRQRLLPGVLRHRRGATGGWVSVELAVMGVALGLAVALSRAAVG